MNIFLRSLVILFCSISFSYAQVTISGATGGSNICIDNISSTALTNIVIGETNNNDIASGGTFVLSLGSGNGFQWAAIPTVTFAGGGNITSVGINTTSGTSITLTIGITTTTGFDVITISNLFVKAVSPPATGQIALISRSSGVPGGTASVSGSVGVSYGLLSSREAPTFSLSLADDYCANSSSVLLLPTPTFSGTALATLSNWSGSGTSITGKTLSVSGSNFYFNPSSITGLSATTATGLQVNYSISLSGTGGCVISASQNVNVYNVPTANFNLPSNPLLGQIKTTDAPFAFTPTTSGGNFSGLGISNNNFYPLVVGGGGTSVVTYNYTNTVSGCSNFSSATISVIGASIASSTQVTITGATGGTNICINNPTATALTDIEIGEVGTADIQVASGSGSTFVLSLVTSSGFTWASVPTISIAGGGDLTGATINTISGSAISITLTGAATSALDVVQIKNIFVKALSPPTFGQAVAITRPSGLAGGTATITGTVGADFGILSSTQAPSSFLSSISNVYCGNSPQILLSAFPTIAGTSSLFSLQYLSGPGSITGSTLNIIGGNYYMDPASIVGISSTLGTALNILYSSTLTGGCITSAFQTTTIFGIPALDFNVPTDGVTPGNMRQSDVTFNLIGIPSGGSFSGNGVNGNVFDTRIVPINQLIPVTYTATINQCTNSISKNIKVVTATGIVSLQQNYCFSQSSSAITINGSNLPQAFAMGDYELVSIIGPGITGTVNGSGTGGTFIFDPTSVPAGQLDITQKIKVRTRKWRNTAFVSGYYWSGVPVSTCLAYPSIVFNYFDYQQVTLPFSSVISGIDYQLNADFNYAGAPNYYCVGSTGYGALLYGYDYKGTSQGAMTSTLNPYWEIQPDIEQDIIIYSNPPAPNIALPSNSNCFNGSIGNYTATNVVPSGSVYWWDNASSPVISGVGSLASGPSVNGNSITIVNTSSSNKIFKATQQLNGCLSLATTFPGIVYSLPPRPSIISPTITGSPIVNLKVCQNSSLPALTVTGIASTFTGAYFKWYRNLLSNDLQVSSANYSPSNVDLNTFNTSGSVLFYVTQVVNGCESSTTGTGALQINIGINSIPGVVSLSNTGYQYCKDATSLSNISVSGSYLNNTINYYKYDTYYGGTTLVGSKFLASNTTAILTQNNITSSGVDLSTAGKYYYIPVSQVEKGCESYLSYIYFYIQDVPSAPSVAPIPTYCNGTNPDPITITGAIGRVNFYDIDNTTLLSSSGTNLFTLPNTIVGLSGAYTYYFSQTVGVCTSAGFTPAVVNLTNSIPGPVFDTGTQSIIGYCFGESVLDFKVQNVIGNSTEWRNTLNSVLGYGTSFTTTITSTTLGTTFKAYQYFNGCYSVASADVQLVIYPKPPAPSVLPGGLFCSTTTSSIYPLQATTLAGYDLTWYTDPLHSNPPLGSAVGANFSSGVDLSVGDQIPRTFYATNTKYYTLPTPRRCESDNSSASITVNPTPYPVLARNLSGVSSRGLLNDTICRNAVAVPLANYSNINGGTFYADSKASPPIANFDPSNYSPGLHTLIYSVVTSFTGIQCTGDTALKIRIVTAPIADFSISSLCVGDTVNLVSSVTSGLVSVGVFDPIQVYKWNFASAQALSGDSISNPQVLFNNPFNYPIDMKVTSKLGCSDHKLKAVTVDPYPLVAFNSRNSCIGSVTQIDNKTSFGVGTIKTLNWDFGDLTSLVITSTGYSVTTGTSAPGTTFGSYSKISHVYGSAGVYNQFLYAESLNGCISTLTSRFFMVPSVKVQPGSPYLQDFEASNGGFIPNNAVSSWEYGTPAKTYISGAASGSKAWVTSLTGGYISGDTTSVYCPCFDISNLQKPMVSLSIRSAFDRAGLDGTVLQVYDDNKGLWYPVGNVSSPNGSGINWYSQTGIAGRPGNQAFVNVGWSLADTLGIWQTARYKLDKFTDEAGVPVNLDLSSLKFRIALGSLQQSGSGKGNGFAFDDFSILERDKLLVLENFTNTSNQQDVVGSDKRVNYLVNSNRKDLVSISYHTAFPGSDSLNQLNVADPSAKALYYGVSQTPYSILSGNKAAGNSFSIGQDIIDTVSLRSAKFAMTVSSVNTGGSSYTINVTLFAKEDITDETFITVAMLERTLDGTNLLARNGQKQFEWVMRKLLPDAAGVSLSSGWAKGEVKSFQYVASLTNPFDAVQVGSVAYIQNKRTKEIYQSGYDGPQLAVTPVPVTGIAKPLSEKDIVVYPNPTSGEINIQLNREMTKDVQYFVYDMLGNLQTSGTITKDISLKKIDANDYPSGIYFLKIDGIVKRVTVVK